ncbi:MAG: hypothetical protein H7Y86_20615 [Rhizobacter sp.]|nr:hypothetical protein [Ferruginibacter sp.]
MARVVILFIYLILSIYGFGACMLDYFGIYEPWKLVGETEFAAFHTFQGNRIIGIFVIPLAIATIFGLAACLFPVKYVKKKWLWLSMLSMTMVWILSFTIQIPIQFILNTRKDMQLINELLYTNWFRFAADAFQVVFVLVILWQLFQQHSKLLRTEARKY